MRRFRAGVLVLAICSLSGAARAAAFAEATHGPASLAFVRGVPVLHLYGSPEAMGEQHGKLLGKQMKVLHEQYLNKVLLPGGKDIGLRRQVLKLSRQMAKSIPRHYVREMEALAEGSGLAYEDVLLMNTLFDVKRGVLCTTVVAVGDRSADGKPVFGRNLDFPTLGVAQKYSCVVVFHPAKGRAVASIAWPGLIGVLSGMNELGVSAGVMEVHLRGSQITATPYAMVFRTALTGATSTRDVLAVVKRRSRTSSNNLMICDAAGDAACAELGVRKVAVRRPVNGVLYATNHFRSKELGSPWMCWRIPRVRRALKDGRKVDEALAKKILHAVAYKTMTMQSIVFRPAGREFLLAIGETPATQHKYVRLTRSVLFPARGKAR